MSTTILLLAAFACTQPTPLDYEIIAEFPHDPAAYTQGLLFHDGGIFESTGQYGKSDLRRVELASGQVHVLHRLSSDRFGEGLALVNNQLYQITWKSGVAYIYRLPEGAVTDSFTIEGEGWGLTYDGSALILSDGTSNLRFLDPTSHEVVRSVDVTDEGQPVTQLNELEFVNGYVLANVYRTDWILKIDPSTGVVSDRYSLRGIRSYDPNGEQVLNGIAYDAEGDRLFVTGKYWDTLFEIRLLSEPGEL